MVELKPNTAQINRVLLFEGDFYGTRLMVKSFCCGWMKQQVSMKCNLHGYGCPDKLIVPTKQGWVGQARNADYKIDFCPSCGTRLPEVKNAD